MFPRKPLAALAAVTAALALAIPVASANAATATPAVRTASLGIGGHLSPGTLECGFLVSQLPFAEQPGNTLYLNFLGNVLLYSGCGGAAI